MLEGFPLGSYLLLVDYTGRLFRAGKAAISREEMSAFRSSIWLPYPAWPSRSRRTKNNANDSDSVHPPSSGRRTWLTMFLPVWAVMAATRPLCQ